MCDSGLETRQGKSYKDLEDTVVSESCKDLKKIVGEYSEDSTVTVFGDCRSDSGYKIAEILPILLSVAT